MLWGLLRKRLLKKENMIDQTEIRKTPKQTSPPERERWERHYRRIYRTDRLTRLLITAGGYGVIISIVGILSFLIIQSWPLARDAVVEEFFTTPLRSDASKILLTGIDAYREIFYTLDEAGHLQFYRSATRDLIRTDTLPLLPGEKILAAAKGSLHDELIAAGTDAGRIITAEIEMKPRYTAAGRTVEAALLLRDTWQAPADSAGVVQIQRLAFTRNEDGAQFWSYVDQYGRLQLRIYDADEENEHFYDLTPRLPASPVLSLTISHNGENLVVGQQNGFATWFQFSDFEEISLKDTWQASPHPLSALGYLLGDQTVAIGDAQGGVSVWFPVRTTANIFKFHKVHTFESLENAVALIAVSPRNRNFLTIDTRGNAKLHYSTTGKTQLSFAPSEHPIVAAAFSPKGDGIVAMDAQQQFSLFQLDNPHPETTLQTLFGRVWYEGYPKPEFVWQSTGGSDEFEPKLSLIPVIFGTMKGTLYAMLFSVPIAILAAIYVSQFAPAWMARKVKPTVEIMAALPSVVIGFLAGLYFAPIFEKYLMTLFLFTLWMPVMFAAGLWVWWLIPEEKRVKLPAGLEMVFLIPFGLAALWLSAEFGKPVEQLLFAGNFQQWLYQSFGITYETRNSIVVGFALGFAVIPIIFTMAEDALSNVPDSLSSASLALGASRWQTVRRVVLPAASGGIFAAVMLGLGRAVGETMIVLMATGNTPILDINPFNGFRAMSASIAVEIPEAPVGGTLYRVLFLTALLLFIFTFVANTLASLVGERLRKKYSRF